MQLLFFFKQTIHLLYNWKMLPAYHILKYIWRLLLPLHIFNSAIMMRGWYHYLKNLLLPPISNPKSTVFIVLSLPMSETIFFLGCCPFACCRNLLNLGIFLLTRTLNPVAVIIHPKLSSPVIAILLNSTAIVITSSAISPLHHMRAATKIQHRLHQSPPYAMSDDLLSLFLLYSCSTNHAE